MYNNSFDKLHNKIREMLCSKGLENLENPIIQLIRQGLQEMKFVNLEDFEIQREVLNQLRRKVDALEMRVNELEKLKK